MNHPNPSPLALVVDALKRMDQKKFALDLIGKFANSATSYQQYDEIAYLYTDCKEYAKAVTYLEKCLASATEGEVLYSIRANLAKVLNYLNEPKKALAYSKANKAVIPTELETDLEIAFSHYLLGDYQTSERMMRELLNNPDLPVPLRDRVRYNLGTYKMEAGDFHGGLHDLVVLGHKTGIVPIKELPIPKWTGYPDTDKTLIVLAEGGLGDEIIGIRFLKHLQERGYKPVWVTNNPQLKDVMDRMGYPCVTDIREIDPSNAMYTQAFYVPVYLNLGPDEVWQGPYLTPNPEYIEKWEQVLNNSRDGVPYIAIKWFGNMEYDQDLHRSVPFEKMLELERHGQLFSLQLEGLHPSPHPTVGDLGSEIEHIEDTLAILSLVDISVTSCTSVAHMIGALGVKGIICPPLVTYYCWLGRDDHYSHWYGENLRVVRQTQHKNWDTVFETVHKLLTE